MSGITVFISYSHDSEAHRELVLGLSERLRADGIETILAQYVNGAPQQGWPRWMLEGLDTAQFVLVVCTETYYRRFRGHETPGKGKGVDWEGALITQELYDARSNTLKFVPVLFSADGAEFVPEPLRAFNHYTVISKETYQGLYDFLLGQSGVEPGPLGSIKPRERARGRALTFDEAPAGATSFKADISRIVKYAPDGTHRARRGNTASERRVAESSRRGVATTARAHVCGPWRRRKDFPRCEVGGGSRAPRLAGL
jgi:hypothetical protein